MYNKLRRSHAFGLYLSILPLLSAWILIAVRAIVYIFYKPTSSFTESVKEEVVIGTVDSLPLSKLHIRIHHRDHLKR